MPFQKRADPLYHTDVQRDRKDRTRWRWRVVFVDPDEGQESGGGYLCEAAARVDLAWFLKDWEKRRRREGKIQTPTPEKLLYGE